MYSCGPKTVQNTLIIRSINVFMFCFVLFLVKEIMSDLIDPVEPLLNYDRTTKMRRHNAIIREFMARMNGKKNEKKK